MIAFAFEQIGDSSSADLHGRIGTTVVPDDAWSHHAVGHALYNQVHPCDATLHADVLVLQ